VAGGGPGAEVVGLAFQRCVAVDRGSLGLDRCLDSSLRLLDDVRQLVAQ